MDKLCEHRGKAGIEKGAGRNGANAVCILTINDRQKATQTKKRVFGHKTRKKRTLKIKNIDKKRAVSRREP